MGPFAHSRNYYRGDNWNKNIKFTAEGNIQPYACIPTRLIINRLNDILSVYTHAYGQRLIVIIYGLNVGVFCVCVNLVSPHVHMRAFT